MPNRGKSLCVKSENEYKTLGKYSKCKTILNGVENNTIKQFETITSSDPNCKIVLFWLYKILERRYYIDNYIIFKCDHGKIYFERYI